MVRLDVIKTVPLLAATLFMTVQYGDTAVLIPEEVPTIFGVLYSLLPPIKIGQDSRMGFGFRVGPNIDTQVLLELGPQTNTGTLGPGSSKRQSQEQRVDPNLRDTKKLMKKLMDSLQKRLRPDLTENEVIKNNTATTKE